MDTWTDETTQLMVSELISNYILVVKNYNKRQGEMTYVIERLKNLSALVNASESDVPKELFINWLNETLEELLKMENIHSV